MADTIGSILGNTLGEAAAFAAGVAIGPVLRPLLQELENTSWSEYPNRPVDAGLLAQAVAQSKIPADTATAEALLEGYSPSAFAEMIAAAKVGPSFGQAMDMWRRTVIDQNLFEQVLALLGIQESWVALLEGLKDQTYSVADLANGLQQGFVPNDGILPPAPQVGDPTVIQNPPIDIDPVAEAAKSGVTADQLTLAADLVGLPPGPELVQTWVRRGAASEQDLVNAIVQGHTKTEWAQKYLDTLGQLLSAPEYAGLYIRGWITQQEMYDGGALTGFSPAQMDLLSENRGRPATAHQSFIGNLRGGHVGDSDDGIDADFLLSVKESDIRPEWAPVLWAGRYTLPGYFVLKPIVSGGGATVAEAEQALLLQGWEPNWAKLTAASFAAGATVKQKEATAAALGEEFQIGDLSETDYTAALTALGYTPAAVTMEVNLAKFAAAKTYRTKAIEAISKNYIASRETKANAQAALTAANVGADAQTMLFSYWDIEKGQVMKTLTQAQIRTAYTKNVISEADALEALEALGLSASDATTYLTS